jgi:hypothetical protein
VFEKMTVSTLRLTRLVELIRKAGEAHHQAFAAVDGEDADWPAWYAEFLIKPMRELGLNVVSVQALSEELSGLQEAYEGRTTGLDWQTLYARELLDRYG